MSLPSFREFKEVVAPRFIEGARFIEGNSSSNPEHSAIAGSQCYSTPIGRSKIHHIVIHSY